MKRTFAAALFALLTVTAPAHAALVQIGGWSENIDLNFGNGYTLAGGAGGPIVSGLLLKGDAEVYHFDGRRLCSNVVKSGLACGFIF